MGYSSLMTETVTEAKARAARLTARAVALEAGLVSECDPAARRAIYAKAGTLRAEARDGVLLAQSREQYGAARSARARRDLAFSQLP
jgi:hypothetical protein